MMISSSARLGQKLMKVFDLRPGIKEITLHVTKDEATLSVVYLAPSDVDLSELEEFKIIPKTEVDKEVVG